MEPKCIQFTYTIEYYDMIVFIYIIRIWEQHLESLIKFNLIEI